MYSVLDVPGPTFLIAYALIAGAALWIVWVVVGAREARPAQRMPVRDPYEIAYLRGEEEALVEVVVLSLVRRKLLEPDPPRLKTRLNYRIDETAPEIERAILQACKTSQIASTLKNDVTVLRATGPYRRGLIEEGLLATSDIRQARWRIVGIGAAVLLALALAKIIFALAHGHRNIGLLIFLAIFSTAFLVRIVQRPRTRAGDDVLRDLESLFMRLGNTPSGNSLNEAMAVAAVFGIAGGIGDPDWQQLFPPRNDNSGCGSSFGFDGCGGGGGCGGCGGCGS